MPPKNKKSTPIGVAIVGAGTVGGGVCACCGITGK